MTGTTAAAAARAHKWNIHRRPPHPDPPPSAAADPRRSLRPRRGRPPISGDLADYCFSSSEEEEMKGRRKVKLVIKLRPDPAAAADGSSSSSGCSTSEDDEDVKPLKKRRISGYDDGGDGSGYKTEMKSDVVVRRSKCSFPGVSRNQPKRTPLPERKALESVLDVLQKKDTYGVFAEPVDPEELPDYREVIEHPMDFGTVRKKLARKVYRTLEQFEDDVFLICSNAMQYNAPDTIYFRQARAIESMGRKNFQILRSDLRCVGTEHKSEERVKCSSMDKKPMKKTLCRFDQEPVGSDISSTATFASAADACNRIRTAPANAVERPATADRLRTTRVNAVDKAASADKLSMVRPKTSDKHAKNSDKHAKTSDKHATATRLSTWKANAVVKPEAANDSSFIEANRVEKHATPNANRKVKANDIAKPVNENELSTTRPNEIGPPIITKGSSIVQPNGTIQPATANGLITMGTNGIEQPATANALSSTTQLNGIEQPATTAALNSTTLDGIEQPAIGNGLSSLEANTFDKPSTVCSMDCNSSLGESKSEKGESRSEKADEFSEKSSPSKSIVRKSYLIDENCRTTYNKSDQPLAAETDSIFDVFESEEKQLVAVGTHVEHSYARSLAQFAAPLGSVGWEIAAKRIEMALPAGIKFGPGWVGEYEPLPTPILSFDNHSQHPLRYGSKLPYKAASDKDQDMKERSKATQNCDSKNMSLGMKNRVTPGIPLRKLNLGDGTVLGEQRQSWFGVSAASRPRITNAMSRQQKEGIDIDVAKSYNNVPEQLDVCNSSSVNSTLVEKSPIIPEFHNEAHKQRLFGVSTETPPRVTSLMLQRQKDQLAIDFTKAYNNVQEQPRVRNLSLSSRIHAEAALQSPRFMSEPNKQRLAGVTNMMLQQQKHHVTIDFTKACSDISEQKGMNNSASVINSPIETTLPQSDSHSQAWKQGLFGISGDIRVANAMLQQQKGQVSIDFGNAYSNVADQVRVCNSFISSSSAVELSSQRTESHSAVTSSRPPGMISMSRNQVQPEPQKQPELVNLQTATDALGLTVGGLSNKKVVGGSDNGRVNTSLEFFSNHQPGIAGFRAAHGSQGHALDFKLMGSSRKFSAQSNNSKTDIYTTKHVIPPSTQARIDDLAAAKAVTAAAGTRGPYGVSTEYGPVGDMGPPNTQIQSSPFPNSAWRTPSAAARIHGDSVLRPMPQFFPHPILVAEESQFQNRGMVFFPQLVPADLSRFHGLTPCQDLLQHSQPRQRDMLPPDLNIGFPPPGSPVRHSSGILVDSQQPDLALQL